MAFVRNPLALTGKDIINCFSSSLSFDTTAGACGGLLLNWNLRTSYQAVFSPTRGSPRHPLLSFAKGHSYTRTPPPGFERAFCPQSFIGCRESGKYILQSYLPLTAFNSSWPFSTGKIVRQNASTQDSKGESTTMKKLAFHEGMGLRLVNENGFLSWCRNAYISTVAAIGMMNSSDLPLARTAACGVLFIAGMNMLWGSGSHLVNLVRLRKVVPISGVVLSLNVLGTILHALLYVFLLLIYVSLFIDPKRSKQHHDHHHKREADVISIHHTDSNDDEVSNVKSIQNKF